MPLSIDSDISSIPIKLHRIKRHSNLRNSTKPSLSINVVEMPHTNTWYNYRHISILANRVKNLRLIDDWTSLSKKKVRTKMKNDPELDLNIFGWPPHSNHIEMNIRRNCEQNFKRKYWFCFQTTMTTATSWGFKCIGLKSTDQYSTPSLANIHSYYKFTAH